MARTYKRDALGRFAGGGGGGGRPKARPVSRGANRLTRDNAGRITSQGGAGATARGGRLRTASGKQRAVQTARIAGGGGKLRGGKKNGAVSGVKAIPKGDLKRYRMLQNKITPLRKALDRDGSTMMGSTDFKSRDKAAARYNLNNRRLKRITDTMRKLSNSPTSPNIPRLSEVTASGRRLGRTSAIKRMDGPRKMRGQSFRGLRGQYSDGRVQYDDEYMNRLYKRTQNESRKRMPRSKGAISRPKPTPPMAPVRSTGRTRSQAGAAYRKKVNQLGKKAAAQRGFIAALDRGQRGGFTQSDTRLVFARGRYQQMTLTGGVTSVRAGGMRQVGTRSSSGRITPWRTRSRAANP